MLLDDELTFCGIDQDLDKQLAVIVEPHWKHLAPYINPSTPPGSEEPVIEQLKKWRERMHPTFGDLSEILSRIYIQPPSPSSMIAKDTRTPSPSKDHDGMYSSTCVSIVVSISAHVLL